MGDKHILFDDTEETIFAMNCYIDATRNLDVGREKQIEIARWLTAFFSQRAPANLYVCCFSKEGSLLSQWRGYAPNGGLSIGFDSDVLKAIANQNTIFYGEVIYDPVHQSRLATAEVSKLIGKLPTVTMQNEAKAFAIIEEEIYSTFRIHSAFFKHPLFFEEHEGRVVAP